MFLFTYKNFSSDISIYNFFIFSYMLSFNIDNELVILITKHFAMEQYYLYAQFFIPAGFPGPLS